MSIAEQLGDVLNILLIAVSVLCVVLIFAVAWAAVEGLQAPRDHLGRFRPLTLWERLMRRLRRLQ